MSFQNTKSNLDYNHPIRPPSTVMKLDRLGSFHQTRLSFTRRLIDDLKYQKSKIEIYQWDIDNSGIGSAIIKIALKKETLSLVIFCHSINDEERTDRVIAEKWDMTFSLFRGIPNKNELNQASKKATPQEGGFFIFSISNSQLNFLEYNLWSPLTLPSDFQRTYRPIHFLPANQVQLFLRLDSCRK